MYLFDTIRARSCQNKRPKTLAHKIRLFWRRSHGYPHADSFFSLKTSEFFIPRQKDASNFLEYALKIFSPFFLYFLRQKGWKIQNFAMHNWGKKKMFPRANIELVQTHGLLLLPSQRGRCVYFFYCLATEFPIVSRIYRFTGSLASSSRSTRGAFILQAAKKDRFPRVYIYLQISRSFSIQFLCRLWSLSWCETERERERDGAAKESASALSA